MNERAHTDTFASLVAVYQATTANTTMKNAARTARDLPDPVVAGSSDQEASGGLEDLIIFNQGL